MRQKSQKSLVAVFYCVVLLSSSIPVTQANPALSSAAWCDTYARDYALKRSQQGQILGGTAIGSLVGFGVGSIWAASGIGAAIGAAIGIIGSAIDQWRIADQIRAITYEDCVAGRVP